jgi:cytochrome c556
MPTLVSAAAIAGLLFVSVAAAHEHAHTHGHDHGTGVVKERRDLMAQIERTWVEINKKIDAKTKTDFIKTDALAIRDMALKVTGLFPPGSMDPPTQAKVVIWQKWLGFERLAGALVTESQKLAETDAADLKALAAQTRILTRTCTDCHYTYRRRR